MNSRIDERVEYCISAELGYALKHFPNNKHQLAALFEEVGELSQALIDHDRGKKTGAQVFEEAVQVAAMAIRIALEGSEEFGYTFDHAHYQAFPTDRQPKAKPVVDPCEQRNCPECRCFLFPSDRVCPHCNARVGSEVTA